VCGNPEGYFFAGDIAQTIVSGVEFRFDGLKDLFFEEFQFRGRPGEIPGVHTLTRNFRTHNGVLKISNIIVKLIAHFFPHTIDKQREEVSFVVGPKPVFLSDTEDVITKMLTEGNRFGVVLVRDKETKDKLCGLCGQNAAALTVEEVKGMEFDDCIVYNFFSSSKLAGKWRFIGAAYDKVGAPAEDGRPYPEFSLSEFKVFQTELKRLYVLITRAKRNLVFFDDDASGREPFLKLMRHPSIDLVDVKPFDDDLYASIAGDSDLTGWCKKGRELFDSRNYYDASKFFQRGGDAFNKTLSDAHYLLETAKTAQGQEMGSINRKSTKKVAMGSCDLFLKAAKLYEEPPLSRLRDAADCYKEGRDFERSVGLYIQLKEHALAALCYEQLLQWKKAAAQYVLCGDLSRAVEAGGKALEFRYCLNIVDAHSDQLQLQLQPETHSSATLLLRDRLLSTASNHFSTLKNESEMMHFVLRMNYDTAKRFLMLNKHYSLLKEMEIRGDTWLLRDCCAHFNSSYPFTLVLVATPVLVTSLWSNTVASLTLTLPTTPPHENLLLLSQMATSKKLRSCTKPRGSTPARLSTI
jgi:tetratricopeptide (TPR) repeat protein